jgi:hypothetical protein
MLNFVLLLFLAITVTPILASRHTLFAGLTSKIRCMYSNRLKHTPLEDDSHSQQRRRKTIIRQLSDILPKESIAQRTASIRSAVCSKRYKLPKLNRSYSQLNRSFEYSPDAFITTLMP